MIKKVLLVLLVLFVLIQFYRPARNTVLGLQTNDISQSYTVSTEVANILEKSCYDCHSNNTRYPWYAEIQPVRWWLDDHIEEGKKELNFNDFKAYPPRKQYRKLEEIIELVKEREMPLSSYTLIHGDAKLTETEKQTLYTWAEGIRNTMKATYPPDSLARKNRPQPAV